MVVFRRSSIKFPSTICNNTIFFAVVERLLHLFDYYMPTKQRRRTKQRQQQKVRLHRDCDQTKDGLLDWACYSFNHANL